VPKKKKSDRRGKKRKRMRGLVAQTDLGMLKGIAMPLKPKSGRKREVRGK